MKLRLLSVLLLALLLTAGAALATAQPTGERPTAAAGTTISMPVSFTVVAP